MQLKLPSAHPSGKLTPRTSYIICGPLRKMKMLSPLFKNNLMICESRRPLNPVQGSSKHEDLQTVLSLSQPHTQLKSKSRPGRPAISFNEALDFCVRECLCSNSHYFIFQRHRFSPYLAIRDCHKKILCNQSARFRITQERILSF